MAIYETDEEQVEALKKWWKENGTSVVFGVAIGFALLFGWRGWQTYTNQQGEMASGLYQQMLLSLEKKEIQLARDLAGKLLSEHSNTAYAVLAVLNLAYQDLEEGEIDSSYARLQWVIDQNSSLPDFTHIARLRKARLLLSQNKVTEANNLIAGIEFGEFKGSYAELQGDIAIAQGEMDVARTAYTEALESEDLSWQHRELVQMKLDDLGGQEENHIEAIAPISVTGNPNTTQDENSAFQMDSTETSASISATGNPNTTQDENSAFQMDSTETSVSTSATGNPSTTQNENSTFPIESTSASSNTEDMPASISTPE